MYTFISNPDDPNALPLSVLLASDHSVYIGVLTNVVLGLLLVLYAVRGGLAHVVFWGVNLGLAVFVIGLIVDTAELKRIGAPVMGVALLVALALLAGRLWSDAPDPEGLAAPG